MGNRKLLKYKGYFGSCEMCFDENILTGKIEFINSLVTFEASTPQELEDEFKNAVDDYLQTCAELGYEPEKSMSGTFNVRVGPEVHKEAAVYAMDHDISMNQLVCKAIETYIKSEQVVIHNHNHEHTHNVVSSVPIDVFGTKKTIPGNVEWSVNESSRSTH